MEISWMHEPPVLKQDCLGVIKLFSMKNSNIELEKNLSGNLPQIGKRYIGR